jgi:hypothetical protein
VLDGGMATGGSYQTTTGRDIDFGLWLVVLRLIKIAVIDP